MEPIVVSSSELRWSFFKVAPGQLPSAKGQSTLHIVHCSLTSLHLSVEAAEVFSSPCGCRFQLLLPHSGSQPRENALPATSFFFAKISLFALTVGFSSHSGLSWGPENPHFSFLAPCIAIFGIYIPNLRGSFSATSLLHLSRSLSTDLSYTGIVLLFCKKYSVIKIYIKFILCQT